MKFTKMHGAGNDYIYVDCTEVAVNNPVEMAVKVSDVRFGIGSDGLILIKPSEKADFFMEMYNADGSQGKMCGNGIRCVGKYVYDNGLTDKTTLTIDTLSGVKTLKLNIGDELFLYTDGVAGATGENDELFGLDRTVSTLNKYKNCNQKELHKNIEQTLLDYTGNNNQFDDITMLSFKVKSI